MHLLPVPTAFAGYPAALKTQRQYRYYRITGIPDIRYFSLNKRNRKMLFFIMENSTFAISSKRKSVLCSISVNQVLPYRIFYFQLSQLFSLQVFYLFAVRFNSQTRSRHGFNYEQFTTGHIFYQSSLVLFSYIKFGSIRFVEE